MKLAYIRDRLAGLGARQAAREAKRRQLAREPMPRWTSSGLAAKVLANASRSQRLGNNCPK